MAGEPYFSVKRYSLGPLKSRDAVTVMLKVIFFLKGFLKKLTEPKTIKSRAYSVKKTTKHRVERRGKNDRAFRKVAQSLYKMHLIVKH